MYDFKLLGEISKGTSEISNKILNPYTERFSIFCVIYDIWKLWHHKS